MWVRLPMMPVWFWFFRRKVDGKWSESWWKMVRKLTENCWKISPSANALEIFHLLSRNSSDKLDQHVEKVFRHPDTWVLRHPVRLAKFSINSFYSATRTKLYSVRSSWEDWYHRVHRVATSAFWRTFHHEGKISPGWWGWGVHATPITISTITHKVV